MIEPPNSETMRCDTGVPKPKSPPEEIATTANQRQRRPGQPDTSAAPPPSRAGPVIAFRSKSLLATTQPTSPASNSMPTVAGAGSGGSLPCTVSLASVTGPQENHRNTGQLFIPFQQLAYLEPTHLRHVDIEQAQTPGAVFRTSGRSTQKPRHKVPAPHRDKRGRSGVKWRR